MLLSYEIYVVLAAVAALLVLITNTLMSACKKSAKFAPGPPALPLIGNLHQMPMKNFHLKFQEWANQYGPITGLKLGQTNMLLLNDPSAIRDLLEKKSSIYSSRPDLYIRELGNGSLNIAFRDNDDTWRRQRKTYHLRLNVKSANQYLPYQTFDSVQLLNDLLEEPADFSRHLQRYTTSVASTVLYGWRTSDARKGYVKDLMDWMDRTSEAANLQIVDLYPSLRPLIRVLPEFLNSFKKKLSAIKSIEDRLFFDLLENAKQKIKEGKVYPSFIRDMLLEDDSDRLNEVEIAHNAAHGFGAATDTQWNTTLAFIKAMILYPDVQRQAHDEIDKIVSSDRLPQWEDRENLPYIRACIDETLRWMPTTLSAAVPHCNSKADDYGNYHIPERSTIMMNVWALNNASWTNPRVFDPSRHSPEVTALENYGINPNSVLRPHFTFGAGRRVCPGFHVAQRGLFMAISRMLWAFEFRRVDGETIVQDAVTDGFIVRPVTYGCIIEPRSRERAQIIRRQWEEAQKVLDSDGNFKEEFFQRLFTDRKPL
ncbi:putative cytochrome P450 oxidoreductase [Paraphoma chrysanthemicola]|nr:putative cytochrome P450 oxidoreductase [Paraphoma chrysanthemicola]